MRKLRLLLFLLMPLLVLVGISVATAGTNRNFVTPLSGSEEVPPHDIQSRGVAIFHVSDDGTRVDYRLNASNIENVVAGHIHSGTLGTNGPVVVTLVTPACTTLNNGIRCEGTFTAANLVGPLAGHPLSDLLALLEEERAYVNVHTTVFPGGAIRGQINRGP